MEVIDRGGEGEKEIFVVVGVVWVYIEVWMVVEEYVVLGIEVVGIFLFGKLSFVCNFLNLVVEML